MKPICLISRLTAWMLSLALTLPASSYALRNEAATESDLEEKLKTGLEENGVYENIDGLFKARPSLRRFQNEIRELWGKEEGTVRFIGCAKIPDQMQVVHISVWVADEEGKNHLLNEVSRHLYAGQLWPTLNLTFRVDSYDEDDTLDDLPRIFIKQGVDSPPLRIQQFMPTILISHDEEIKQLSPPWLYAVAMDSRLIGRIIGPVSRFLVSEQEDRAIFYLLFSSA